MRKRNLKDAIFSGGERRANGVESANIAPPSSNNKTVRRKGVAIGNNATNKSMTIGGRKKIPSGKNYSSLAEVTQRKVPVLQDYNGKRNHERQVYDGFRKLGELAEFCGGGKKRNRDSIEPIHIGKKRCEGGRKRILSFSRGGQGGERK